MKATESGFPKCGKCERDISYCEAFEPATMHGGGCLECIPRSGCGQCSPMGPFCNLCYLRWRLDRQQHGLNVWRAERQDHKRKLQQRAKEPGGNGRGDVG